MPYQWLMVKNKTIIGPKSSEEQKVLFIPPRAGVYQCVLSVSSWPASADSEVAARAEVFAKRVVLVAVAENPALEVSDLWFWLICLNRLLNMNIKMNTNTKTGLHLAGHLGSMQSIHRI